MDGRQDGMMLDSGPGMQIDGGADQLHQKVQYVCGCKSDFNLLTSFSVRQEEWAGSRRPGNQVQELQWSDLLQGEAERANPVRSTM